MLTIKPQHELSLSELMRCYLYKDMVRRGRIDMSFPLTAATDRLVDTHRFLYDVGIWSTL